MVTFISQNIKYIRKEKGLTQEEFAQELGVSRAALSSYEEGRAEPKLAFIQQLALYTSYNIDDLLNKPLAPGLVLKADYTGKHLRVLSVAVERQQQEERVVLVPVKAAAGYLEGFGDVSYIRSLPAFSLPLPELSKERTYRLFQIKGDSMKPVPDGSYIITEYLQDWRYIKDNQCYVLVTRDEGIVYKRVLNRLDEDMLILQSDNPEYKPYSVAIEYLAEVWRAIGYISLQLPDRANHQDLDPNTIMSALIKIGQDIEHIKRHTEKQ